VTGEEFFHAFNSYFPECAALNGAAEQGKTALAGPADVTTPTGLFETLTS